ncbi:hypothetical protein K7X08_014691 [Anisodus acutangulus]|uniref:Uncharacterized protein n=1 Tax=Anisodus acutangulus TaxID=402998 RepID=A0A9Q1R4L1_9SOLA|nr:hypothetical protein K7X08_014691 [Anisodus acutangulus]
MASSFCFLVVATLIMATPLVSMNVEMKLISSTPVEFLANPPVPVASPFSEVSPDIAPLLPSSGGVVPPTSSVPTIPSNPTKNPDDMIVSSRQLVLFDIGIWYLKYTDSIGGSL